MNAEELARKHGINGKKLRIMLRAHPELTSGHQHGQHYEIDEAIEARIVSHPKFSQLLRR